MGAGMDADAIYAGLVDGSVTEVPPALVGPIGDRARQNTISPDTDARLGAVRVALALPAANAVPVALGLVRDTDVRVRRRAVNVALKAQAAGLPVLRRLAGDPDEGIATAVLDVLVTAVDAASAGMAHDLLKDPRASVRARAAALAGAAGGPGLLVDLRKSQWDSDPAVREAISLAVDRLTGKAPRPAPGKWWERDPIPDEGGPAAPPPPFVPPPVATTPEPPAPAAPPAPVADTAGWLARLGQAAPEQRVAALAGPPADLQAFVQRWRAGGDPAVGRGIAHAIAGLDHQAWSMRLQPLLADPDPGVRGAAAEAVGKVGGLSTIPWVTPLLKDADPAVVVSAASAVGSLCARFQRAPMARQWLTSLTNDPRPGVADAARAALAAAGA